MMDILDFLFPAVWSFGASFFFAFCFNGNKWDMLFGGFCGSAGWVVYIFAGKYFSQGEAFFVSSFVVASLSEIFAIAFKKPAIIYLIPGILPVVPGGGIFYMMRSVVQGRLEESVVVGYDTLIAACSIAFGTAVASSVFRIILIVKKRRQK